MGGIGTLLNPIGAVADKVGGGVGKVLDPVGAIGKAAGGSETTGGILIDPAGALRKKRRAQQQSGDTQGKSLLAE